MDIARLPPHSERKGSGIELTLCSIFAISSPMLNLLLVFAALFPFSAFALDAPACGTKKDELCSCELSALKPTQASVGLFEVKRKQEKVAKHKKKSAAKLDKYLRKKFQPVVLGPGKNLYLTDHHHLGRALLAEGISQTYCRIEADLSSLKEKDFWAEMEKRKLVHLYEKGKSIQASDLPGSISTLRDDPFRSLAGRVREEGGFEKSKAPFSEFAWAEYFRGKLPEPKNESEFLALIPKALELAKSPEAKKLSGFLGD